MISLENALLRDIKNLSNESEGYDVVLQVGQHPEIDSFRAHLLILHARSSYFRSILSSKKWGEKNNECVLLLPRISPCVFKVLLGYIYNGSINMSDTTVKSIYLDLLIAANELELSELTENVQEYLISHETDWIRNNFFKIFQITEKSKPFTRLENFCQEIFNTNPAMILNSDGFLELEADFLISLFKRDDIVLDEITIWESVIRWGIAQIKLNTDVSQWTNRDFIRLKKAVKNLIPHIRFFNISGMDHRTKIRPYKKILPKELKEEIKDYFFAQVPPKKFCKLPLRATKSEPNESVVNILDHVTITSIESVLMDISGFCQIAAWIDDNSEPYLPTDIPYDFSLLFRGSRDGMTNARKFHEICGYQGATLIIIKIVESNKILGGYNPDDWICDSSWTTRLNSFIFSMEKNGGTIKNVISRIKDPKHAIWNSAGNPGFGSDLQWFVGVCAPRSYKTPIYESALFSLTNFEVFKVEKKIYKNDSCKNDDSYNDSYKNDDNDGNVKKAMIEYDSDDTVESDSDYIDIDKL